MTSITLHAGESYSLTTGRVERARDYVASTGTEDVSTPVQRALKANDLIALHSLVRTA